MRAVTQEVVGGPEVLRVTDVDRPHPGDGEVLVEVHGAGVNPIDVAVRSGAIPLLGQPPFGVGWDVSGVVAEAGAGVDFAVGDEVFGLALFPKQARAYAEFMISPAVHLAGKPRSWDHTQAGAAPLAALTAWQALVDTAGVSKGHKVLITRAAGGVGHFAVQVAKAMGAQVIALASASKHDFVRGLGADEVIDYREVDFTEVVTGVDVVFDSTSQGESASRVLREGGKLVTISQQGDEKLGELLRSNGQEYHGMSVQPDKTGMEHLAERADTGGLRAHIDATFDLDEANRAHELMETGTVRGKIVLTI